MPTSYIKDKKNKPIMVLATAFLILTIFLIIEQTIGLPHSSQSDHVILTPSQPYTTDTLICEESFSEDNTSFIWFKDEVEQLFLENQTNILSSNTTKNEIWICQVTAYDAEGNFSAQENVSVKIANSPPSTPVVYYEGSPISDGFELIEGQTYDFIFNSTDPDEDVLGYSFAPFVPDFCSIMDSTTGYTRCEVLHEHVTISETDEPGPEEEKNELVSFQATETTGTEKLAAILDLNFTLVPFNNQATFVETITDMSINALTPWEVTLEGFDEELDHPLNFSVESNGELGLVLIDETNTTAVLTFEEGMPNNAHVGNWVVNVSVTDSLGSNETRAPSWFTFNLEINHTNEPPEFITDFSNVAGTQGEEFNLTFEARDNDTGDTLTFYVLRDETDPYCSEDYFIWNESITTTNSSANNASGKIYIENLSIEHVICRNVKLVVKDDTGASQELLVFFNITNVNDPPVIHELSFYEENIQGQTNITNLTVSLYSSPAKYKVNATDIDQLTYDALNTGVLSYQTNDSNFTINEEGFINLEFDDENMIGNHSVLITVFDNGEPSLNDSIIMNVEILLNEPPTIEVPLGIILNQSDDLIIYFNTTDIDGDSMYMEFESNNERFNSTKYNFSLMLESYDDLSYNKSYWKLNLSEWVKNKTETHPIESRPNSSLYSNELVGEHNVSIRVFDETGAHNEETSRANLIFTINNENDPPFFDMAPRNNVSDIEITFSPIAENRPFTKIFYATDFDLFLPSHIHEESLTYIILNNSQGLSDLSFQKHSMYEDRATLSFVPTNNGTHFVELRVEDLEGEGQNISIEFSVYKQTDPPIFEEVKPYFDTGTEETIQEFILTSEEGIDTPLYIEWEENSSLTFDANISFPDTIYVNNEDGEPNELNVNWYVNDELKEELQNINPAENSSFEYYFDFFSSGTNYVTMEATDLVDSSANWTWEINVENINRPPIYCNDSLEDIIFTGSTSRTDYLSYMSHQRFYDPDDYSEDTGPGSIDPCVEGFTGVRNLESLRFGLEQKAGFCDADFTFDGSNLTIVGRTKGMCEVEFWAEDDYEERVYSDRVTIEILEASNQEETQTERVVTVTETITIPLEFDVDVPKPTKIIYPGEAVFYHNQTIEVPLIIKNNWTEDFSGISISGEGIETSNSGNLSISFSETEIELLRRGEEKEITMFLTNYRTPGPLMINIFAEVTNPEFTDSDTIMLAGLEMAGDSPQSVRALVTYARDLLTTSPECAELNDLLNNAQRSLEQGNAEEALRLIDAAINGCRYLLSQEEEMRRENPGTLKMGLTTSAEYWLEIVLGSIALIFVAIMFYVFGVIRMASKNKD